MSFLVKENWTRLNIDVWKAVEKLTSAPPDMYIELLRYRLQTIGRDELSKPEYMEALNNGEKAREILMALPIPQTEVDCLIFLSQYYHVLQDFQTQVAEKYKEKLTDWILRHNLRYRVTQDCKLELTIPGLFWTEYEYLKKTLEGNVPRKEALSDLEGTLPRLDNGQQTRSFIQTAINLLEGIMTDNSSNAANTLTRALPGCRKLFPHNSLIDCLENIYRFCSDYPNIRHAGNPSSRIRNLKNEDALLMLALAVGFGSFVSGNNAGDKILVGDI